MQLRASQCSHVLLYVSRHSIDMRRLTTGVRSEYCVDRQFRRCENVIQCPYTNLDSIAYAHLGYMV